MATQSRSKVLKVLSLAWLVAFSIPTFAQTTLDRGRQSNADYKESGKLSEADLLEAGRRTFAISSVTSLADEVRSYQDFALRARVLARVADTLWDVDGAKARPLFRSAWEAAEEADAQEPVAKTKDSI